MRRVLIVLALFVAVVVGVIAVARATARSVDGIPCDAGGTVAYHVHAHLTIVVDGHAHYPPAGVGIHPEHLCLYWLHTHDATGIIHIEAPHRITPRLREFFDIWGQPLTKHRVAEYLVPAVRRQEVFVGEKRWRRGAGNIPLRKHTAVTIEIGPPFPVPFPANFYGL